MRAPSVRPGGAGHALNTTPMSATAVRIFTGAVLPQLHDTVVMQEDVVVDTTDGRATVAIPAGLRPGANVRKAGEDVAAGSTVLRPERSCAPRIWRRWLRSASLKSTASRGCGWPSSPRATRSCVQALLLAEGQVYDANAPIAGIAGHQRGCRRHRPRRPA